MENLIVPKNSLPKQDNRKIISDYASEISQRMMENIKANKPLQEITMQSLMKSMEPIETPKFTTAQDVLKSQDKLGVFADYLKSPEAQRNIGRIFGNISYDRQTGGYNTFGDRMARESEAEMQRKQDIARTQQMNQQKTAQDIYNNLSNAERETYELEAEMQKNLAMEDYRNRSLEQEAALAKVKLAAQEQIAAANRANDLQIALMRAKNEGNAGELDDKFKATVLDVQNFKSLFDEPGIKNFGNNPLSNIAARAGEPFRVGLRAMNVKNADETEFDAQRSMLFSNISRNLGGEKGVLSDKDIERVGKALPSLSDTPEQKAAKMNVIENTINNALIAKGYAPIDFTSKNDPLGIR